VRIMVQNSGLKEKRIHRVTGHGDRGLVVANPMSVRNNRVELTLLR